MLGRWLPVAATSVTLERMNTASNHSHTQMKPFSSGPSASLKLSILQGGCADVGIRRRWRARRGLLDAVLWSGAPPALVPGPVIIDHPGSHKMIGSVTSSYAIRRSSVSEVERCPCLVSGGLCRRVM